MDHENHDPAENFEEGPLPTPREFPIGINEQGVPVMLSEQELSMHGLVLGGLPSARAARFHPIIAGLRTLGWSGTLMSMTPDPSLDALRKAHTPEQHLSASDKEAFSWIQPLSGMEAPTAVEALLTLVEFDDCYFQGINRTLLSQMLALHLDAHALDPARFPRPTLHDIGTGLESVGSVASRTLSEALRSRLELLEEHLPDEPRIRYPTLLSPSRDTVRAAAGLGIKLTNIGESAAGKHLLFPGPHRLEFDPTAEGLGWVELDQLARPDLSRVVSSCLLARLSAHALGLTTRSGARPAPRFLIIDGADWVARELLLDLLSRARAARIIVLLGVRSPEDWCDAYGDDWPRVIQSINVVLAAADAGSNATSDSAGRLAAYFGPLLPAARTSEPAPTRLRVGKPVERLVRVTIPGARR